MFDNIAVASGFSFLALPLKFGVCIAAQRKLLPYGLLQLFAGITILLMLAFTNENVAVGVGTTEKLTSGKIYSAHIANVCLQCLPLNRFLRNSGTYYNSNVLTFRRLEKYTKTWIKNRVAFHRPSM